MNFYEVFFIIIITKHILLVLGTFMTHIPIHISMNILQTYHYLIYNDLTNNRFIKLLILNLFKNHPLFKNFQIDN